MAIEETTRRQDQISAELKRLVGEAFIQVEFPQGCLVTISRVTVARDLARATIFLTVIPEELWVAVKNDLKKAKPEIQNHIAGRLPTHRTPKLQYVLDAREQKARKLEAILDDIAKNE